MKLVKKIKIAPDVSRPIVVRQSKGDPMLYGDKLVKTLREMAENAQKRFWVYSPYIGSWDGVKRIIGDDWQLKGAIQVRLLTDIRNKGWIDPITFNAFRNRGEVATLPGLHAKIYLADNQILITSANLTQTAFQKRYEAGITRKCTIADEEYLKFLWKTSTDIPTKWNPKKHRWAKNQEEQGSSGLGIKWNLPDAPRGMGDLSYEHKLSAFAKFRSLYLSNVKRAWPKSPVYFEIDSFLNYLFHEHPAKPSEAYKTYKKNGYAKLTEKSRVERLKKYQKLYLLWLKSGKGYDSSGNRAAMHNKVRKILAPSKIQKATWKDIENALSGINALKSNPLNEYVFFNRGNKSNNTLNKVKKSLGYLFDDSKGPISSRFRYCKDNLVGFGPSSVGELIGF